MYTQCYAEFFYTDNVLLNADSLMSMVLLLSPFPLFYI